MFKHPKLSSEFRSRVCAAYHLLQHTHHSISKYKICMLLADRFAVPPNTIQYIHEEHCPTGHRRGRKPKTDPPPPTTKELTRQQLPFEESFQWKVCVAYHDLQMQQITLRGYTRVAEVCLVLAQQFAITPAAVRYIHSKHCPLTHRRTKKRRTIA